jgi:hypothetical protein
VRSFLEEVSLSRVSPLINTCDFEAGSTNSEKNVDRLAHPSTGTIRL